MGLIIGVGGVVVLGLIVVLLLRIYYPGQGEDLSSLASSIKSARRKSETCWGLLIGAFCILILLLLTFLALVVTRYIEHTKLFQPTILKRNTTSHDPETYYPHTEWTDLRHGGGLLHYTPGRETTSVRKVLFLHGNSYELKQYLPALDTLKQLNYDVYAVEYAGFGLTKPINSKEPLITLSTVPNNESVLQDVYDAWELCGDPNAIVIGFSLGGAILGETYEQLKPAPAQIVFLNTFASFPNLVQQKLGFMGKILSPLLDTQWQTPAPKKYHGKVTVVYTKDDTVVPPEQGKQICNIFQQLAPKCIALDSGGHRYSALNHRDQWANDQTLLPARLS